MKAILGILLLLTSLLLQAETIANRYALHSQGQQQRFNHLLKELRCLVCQNQDLADSNATLAEDLKTRIADKIRAGESNAQIKDYLSERYGAFILFKPPLDKRTWLLWFGPLVILALGGWLMQRFARGATAG